MTTSDSKQKRSPKMLISAIAVTLVLCVAPIGSYLFLKGGFQYRLESLHQLEPKEIKEDLSVLINTNAPFAGNARLIHIPGKVESDELNVLQEIDDQIVDRSRFDVVSFGQNTIKGKHKIDFKEATRIESEFQFVLIDTSDIVRGIYVYDPNVGKEIIRHLSVVIPLPRQKSITLNRDKE